MNNQTYVLHLVPFEADQFTEEVYIIWKDFVDKLKDSIELAPTLEQQAADSQHYLSEKYTFQGMNQQEHPVHFVIKLTAYQSLQKYQISYHHYHSYSRSPKIEQLESTIAAYWLPYAYSNEAVLQLVTQNLNEDTIWTLDDLMGNTGEVGSDIIAIFETALCSAQEDLQAMAALVIEINEGYWKEFQPIMHLLQTRIEDNKDSEYALESFEKTVKALQQAKADAYNSLNIYGLIPQISEDLIEANLMQENDQESFLELTTLFCAPNNVYVWYSERTLETSREDIICYLKTYEQWQSHIEPYYGYGRAHPKVSRQEYCEHPLGCYVIISQFLWHYYQLETAEKHLIRSAQMAAQLETAKGEKIIPQQNLEHVEFLNYSGVNYYHNPALYALNYFYLGELYEKQAHYHQAIESYEHFLKLEPRFVAKRLILQDEFYDLLRQIPDSKQAKQRIEQIRDQLANQGKVSFMQLLRSPTQSQVATAFQQVVDQAQFRPYLDTFFKGYQAFFEPNLSVSDFSVHHMLKLNQPRMDLSQGAIKTVESLSVLLPLLTNTQVIKLGFCNLKRLPQEIGSLTQLIGLSIQGNLFKKIPPIILENLTCLEELYLGHNQLKRLPEALANLQTLKILSLPENQLTSLPDSIGT